MLDCCCCFLMRQVQSAAMRAREQKTRRETRKKNPAGAGTDTHTHAHTTNMHTHPTGECRSRAALLFVVLHVKEKSPSLALVCSLSYDTFFFFVFPPTHRRVYRAWSVELLSSFLFFSFLLVLLFLALAQDFLLSGGKKASLRSQKVMGGGGMDGRFPPQQYFG